MSLTESGPRMDDRHSKPAPGENSFAECDEEPPHRRMTSHVDFSTGWTKEAALTVVHVPVPQMSKDVQGLHTSFMLDATVIWSELRGFTEEQLCEAQEAFTQAHQAGEDFLWVFSTSLQEQIGLSQPKTWCHDQILPTTEQVKQVKGDSNQVPVRASSCQHLYIQTKFLSELLKDCDGVPYHLSPRPSAINQAIKTAEREGTKSEDFRSSQNNASGPEEQHFDPTEIWNSTAELPTQLALKPRSVCQIRLVLVCAIVSSLLVTGGCLYTWVHMGQAGVEQPGGTYLDSLNSRALFTLGSLFTVPRMFSEQIIDLGGANNEIYNLTEPYSVSSVVTSRAILHPSNLTKFLVAMQRTSAIVAWTGVAFADGTMYMVIHPDPADGALLMIFVRDAQDVLGYGTCLRLYQLGADQYTPNWASGVEVTCYYDPRAMGWYSTTASARASGWGDNIYSDEFSVPIYNHSLLGVSATAPLFANSDNSSDLLGVVVSHARLASVGYFLDVIQPRKDGAIFATNYRDGNYYLTGAEPGESTTMNYSDAAKQACACNGSQQQILVQDSTIEVITDGFNYVKDQNTGNSSFQDFAYPGHAVWELPMVSLKVYKDVYGLEWQVWSTFPSSNYYGFIIENLEQETLVALCVMLVIFICMGVRACDQNVVISNDSLRADVWILRGSIAIVIINITLYILWISTTQAEVDVIVVDAMEDVGRQFQDALAAQTFSLAFAANQTNIFQWIQSLEIYSGTPASNTNLDSHFCSYLRTFRRVSTFGDVRTIKVGFESGDVLGAVYYNSQIAVMVRSDATGGDLVYYGTSNSCDCSSSNL